MNGRVAALGDSAESGVDRITLDGRPIHLPKSFTYVVLNKPAGFACTRRDPHLPHTIYELLPRSMNRLFTVGRLDVDTEGLLLLTNDGEWANGIAHPRRHVPKTYVANVRPDPTVDDLDALRRGVMLDDGPTHPALVRLLRRFPVEEAASVEVTITEGRKRQVRRMFSALGMEVVHLRRTHVGPIDLGNLPLGRWRALSPEEVTQLGQEAQG